MDVKLGEKNPVAPEPASKKTFQVASSTEKDELHEYILKSPTEEVRSLIERKVVIVDAAFLNRLVTSNQTASLEKFLGYAKDSLLFLGLSVILKDAPLDSALLVIGKLKMVPPRAPFELLKNFGSSPDDCLKVIQLVVQKGWDPQTKNGEGDTLIAFAVKQGHKPEGPLCQGLAKLGVV